MNDQPMTIEGEPAPRFQLYRCDIDRQPYECVAKYETISEVLAHRWRLDTTYKILVDRKPMTLVEFRAWAKTQDRTT